MNKSFVELTGYQADECLGKPAVDLMDIQDNGTRSLIKRDVSYTNVPHVKPYMYMYNTNLYLMLH